MSICWYCYWGWPKIIADIYDHALSELDNYSDPLHFGPAHIVWEDENFDQAEWCLENFDKYKGGFTEKELTIVKQSLEELSKVPINLRDIVPDDYDLEYPENFPPPKDVKMVKR